MKNYQVRIRKDETGNEKFSESIALLGGGTVTQIRTLTGTFESMSDAFEKMANVPELAEWEVISVILIDTDNSEQLGEDFEWDEEDE